MRINKIRSTVTLTLVFVLSLMLMGCFSENATEDNVDGALKYLNKAEGKESQEVAEIPEEDRHNSYIKAIGTDYDSAAPADTTVSAMFTIKDFDLENKTLSFLAYTEELYDAREITLMQIGDTINIDGREIVVESIQDKEGELFINGGIEEGGVELITAGDDAYRARQMDDYATYVEIGRSTLPLSESLIINDSYKDASIPVEADYESLETYLDKLDGASDSFSYLSTTVKIVGGQITEITRIWTP